jgi:hypothetical protein
MEYKIVFTGASNGWEHETLGTATDTDIADSMIEGLAPDYARRLDLKLSYGAVTYGINGGVDAGIELYDYTSDECVAVIGYVENDEYEEDEDDEDEENTCAVCLSDYDADETTWIDGFRPKDSERVVSGFVCDDCRKAGTR